MTLEAAKYTYVYLVSEHCRDVFVWVQNDVMFRRMIIRFSVDSGKRAHQGHLNA